MNRHLIAAALLLTAMAGPYAAATQTSPDWQTQAVHALEHMHDANAEATLAVVRYASNGLHSSPRALQAVNAAIDNEPAAADLIALKMRLCDNLAGSCDRQALALQLRHLAPHNALGWMSVLQQAVAARQTGKATRVLGAMAGAETFTTYRLALLKRLYETLAYLPAPVDLAALDHSLAPVDLRRMQALIWVGFTPITDYRPLLHACQPDNAAFAQRRSSCRQLGRLLELHSDRVMDVAVGLALERWTTDNAHAYHHAMQRTLQWRWLSHAYGDACTEPKAPMRKTCLDMGMHRHAAHDFFVAVAHKAGQNTTPPAGWGQRFADFEVHADRSRGVTFAAWPQPSPGEAVPATATNTPPQAPHKASGI
ncbi:MAG TPA: hypothetical protein VF271_11210 [Rhodanobacteraceae bacterium]